MPLTDSSVVKWPSSDSCFSHPIGHVCSMQMTGHGAVEPTSLYEMIQVRFFLLLRALLVACLFPVARPHPPAVRRPDFPKAGPRAHRGSRQGTLPRGQVCAPQDKHLRVLQLSALCCPPWWSLDLRQRSRGLLLWRPRSTHRSPLREQGKIRVSWVVWLQVRLVWYSTGV